MPHYHDVLSDLTAPTRSLREAIPDTWGGFVKLHTAALADGAISAKLKEVMALGISVVRQCDGCIAHHAKQAARRGASPEEVAEGIGVALMMTGGPGTVYGPRAWAAYQEFAETASGEAKR